MAHWDIYHNDTLEVERDLPDAAIRAAVAAGRLTADDCARPASTAEPWVRLADLPHLLREGVEPPPPTMVVDLDPDRRLDVRDANPVPKEGVRTGSSAELAPPEPRDEDDEAAEFSLTRGGTEKIEELDLAAMVDVAFQLVLFFLVTATTVLFKSLDVPKPNPETNEPAAQAPKSPSDLQSQYVMVKIDAQGNIEVDREPTRPDALIEKLRKAREETGRLSMLLSADFQAMHKNVVFAYDAANEIGLGIAVARPVDPSKKPE